MCKYYGYIRVSTETQSEKGYGLDVQKEKIENLAAEKGIEITDYFIDAGISGAIKANDGESDVDALRKRPALMELINRLEDGDTVMVANTSRLWRSDVAKVSVRRQLMKRNAQIMSIEQPQYNLYAALDPKNYADKFVAAVMEAVDEMMRDEIALKLATGRSVKANHGDKPAGVCPFGYKYSDDKKSIEIDEEEAPIIKRIFSCGQKGMSLSEIASVLNADGIKTRRGCEWSKAGLKIILNNRFYIGELQHQEKTIIGNHPPIINKIVFGKVQAQLDKHRK